MAATEAIQWMLADVATELEAARLPDMEGGGRERQAERSRIESSMAKLAASKSGAPGCRSSDADHGV